MYNFWFFEIFFQYNTTITVQSFFGQYLKYESIYVVVVLRLQKLKLCKEYLEFESIEI